MTKPSSRKDRRIAYYVLVVVIIGSLAYFVPRTLHEIAIDRAKSCNSCLDSRSAIVKEVEYDSGSAAGYGTSNWISAEYTFVSEDGGVFNYGYILDERFEEGQSVTLRLYKSDLVFVDRSYAHQPWGGIEMMLFLPLPFAFVTLLLLWYTRPTKVMGDVYRSGYVFLSGVVGLFSSVLFAGGLQLVWWPLAVLTASVAVPALALALRRHKHTA